MGQPGTATGPGHRPWQGTGVGMRGGGTALAPDSGEGFWDLGGDLHAHPQGEAGSSPPSGDHFDPKVFAQLFQEDKGEDGVRNEPNGSRNEALEQDSERRVSTCLASGFRRGQGHPAAQPTDSSTNLQARGRLAGHAARAPSSRGLGGRQEAAGAAREAPQPLLCTQMSAACMSPSAPKHISAGITTT